MFVNWQIHLVKRHLLHFVLFHVTALGQNLRPSIQCEYANSQGADGESNKIVLDKKKTVTVWILNTYQVRNHFVSNPTNPKLKRLKFEKI